MRKFIISLVAVSCILCPCFAGTSMDSSNINDSEISKITFTNEMVSINGLEISPLSWFEIEVQDCLLVRSSYEGELYIELSSGIHSVNLIFEDENFNEFKIDHEINFPAGEYDFSLPAFVFYMNLPNESYLITK